MQDEYTIYFNASGALPRKTMLRTTGSWSMIAIISARQMITTKRILDAHHKNTMKSHNNPVQRLCKITLPKHTFQVLDLLW